MKRNFNQHFVFIYNIFSESEKKQRRRPSNASLARFLGHSGDGKVKAWKAGQWPSAEDIAALEKIFGLSLRWLVTGEGKPYEMEHARPDEAVQATVRALQLELQEKERELAEERRLNRQLTARMLVDGVGDKAAVTNIGKVADGHE